VDIRPSDLSGQEIYKLLIGTILPRPIAWVSTQGEDGVNLAPFSFFTCVSTNPPMIGFTVMPGPFGEKDTLRHIRENREFVINVVSRSILDQMNITATDAPPGVNEFELAGLTEEASQCVKVPRVKEAKVHFECKMHSIVGLGLGPDHFVIGEVMNFHVNDEIMMDRYRIDVESLDPVGRMAGNFYTTSDHLLKKLRIPYKDIQSI
jgi:flavin reductase (DIM6/NTAB) family NADH-FMN oxidoreductase RutF